MAFEDWGDANLARETSNSEGTHGGSTRYNLLSAVAGHRAISQQLAANGRAYFCVKDSIDYEIFEGRYNSGDNTVESLLVIDSSNSGSPVLWGTGVRDIYITLPAQALKELVNPEAGFGLMARIAKHQYRERLIALHSSVSQYTVDNPDGILGDPTLRELWTALRKSGGVDADRTMDDELILAAASTRFTLGGHSIRGPNGAADVALFFGKNDDQDYSILGGIGGDLIEMLSQNNVSEWLPREKARVSFANAQATVESDTELSLVVPATGTWYDHVIGSLAASGSPGTTIEVEIERRIGAGSWVGVASNASSASGATASDAHTQYSTPDTSPALTNGETYAYRLTLGAGFTGQLSASNPRGHRIHARLYRAA